MTKVIEAAYCREPVALGVGIYAIYDYAGFNPKFLLVLLNSKFLSYYLNVKFKEKHLAGGYLAINKSTLERLPLVHADIVTQNKMAEVVDKILNIYSDKNYLGNEEYSLVIKQLMDKIDKMVYELFNLTKEEIEEIERFYK